jgi:hypothetical protein
VQRADRVLESGASDGLIHLRGQWRQRRLDPTDLVRKTVQRADRVLESGASDRLIHLRGQWRQRPLDPTDLVRKTVQRADRVLESGASDGLIRQTWYAKQCSALIEFWKVAPATA